MSDVDITLAELQALPKRDLHSHLLLAAPRSCYQALAAEPIPDPPPRFSSLQDFFGYLGRYYLPLLRKPENVQRVVREAFAAAVADGVRELEASVPLIAPLRAGMTWEEYARIFRAEIAEVAGILSVQLEIGHARELSDPWQELLEQAIDTGLFAGIDLYGDELHQNSDQFVYFFNCARAHGFYTKLHCGESSTLADMRRDIERFDPDIVQHGIAAAQSSEFMLELRYDGRVLNLCPSSNYLTGVVPVYEQHPIRTLLDHGVEVHLGTDDFGIFGVSLSEEYLKLLRAGVITRKELDRIR